MAGPGACSENFMQLKDRCTVWPIPSINKIGSNITHKTGVKPNFVHVFTERHTGLVLSALFFKNHVLETT